MTCRSSLDTRNNNPKLRKALEKITETIGLRYHPHHIELLNNKIPHSIKSLTTIESHLEFNCVMYALGIENNQQYIQLAWEVDEHIHADTKFVQFLINDEYMIEEQQATNGCVIVYFDDKIKHIGRLISESRVISKWGCGHLYEHAFFEIPIGYGDTIRFFKPPAHEFVIPLFREYSAPIQVVEFPSTNVAFQN